MPTVIASSTASAFIGPTRLSSTASAVILLPGITASSTASAYIKMFASSTASAVIADSRGTFRGVGTIAERDVLDPLYPGDTFIAQDAPEGQYAQFYNGTDWEMSSGVVAQEGGEARQVRTPTTDVGNEIIDTSNRGILISEDSTAGGLGKGIYIVIPNGSTDADGINILNNAGGGIFIANEGASATGGIFMKNDTTGGILIQDYYDGVAFIGKIGFGGETPVTRPSVTGSRASGAALVSLLDTLNDIGLIYDDTTA